MKKEKSFFSNPICFFCGREMTENWEEYDKYYECDCADAVKDRKITEQIAELNRSRPRQKYRLITRQVLTKI